MAEEALYDSLSMCRFIGIDLESVPHETTNLNFRQLLERHNLVKLLFDRVNECLASRGLKVARGTIVNATIIAAPRSTKNEAKHGTQRCTGRRRVSSSISGMKLHIGVDSKAKLIHSMETTATNVHDAKVLGELLHGNETRVYGDQAHRGNSCRAALQPRRRVFGFAKARYRGLAKTAYRSCD